MIVTKAILAIKPMLKQHFHASEKVFQYSMFLYLDYMKNIFTFYRERTRQMRKWQQQQKGRQNYNRPVQIKQRESSVTVKPDWVVLEEMERTQLSKLSLPTVNDPDDLLCCGALEYYDKTYDRINVKNERPLRRIDRIFHTVTTTDDPIVRKLAKSHPDANVFATDAILATLMTCTRSIYSWDIVVQKIGGKIFLDKRDNTEFGKVLSLLVKS